MTAQDRILLVDDDFRVAWNVGRCLTRAGFAVTTCVDGAEAILLLRDREFDVLITDIQMPRLNGLALVEWVRQNRPETRVVVMTGFGSPAVHRLSIKKGALLYLEKPLDPKLLVDSLRARHTPATELVSIHGIDIFDYVQLLMVTRRSSVLSVTLPDGLTGELYILDGEAVHAECGDDEGQDAFFAMLGVDGGLFSTSAWKPPSSLTIDHGGEGLLLDAARLKDEARRNQARFKRPTRKVEPITEELDEEQNATPTRDCNPALACDADGPTERDEHGPDFRG